jgi:proteasome alpha subunit
MYEEPYRWIEAVGNRRHYLDEQFRQGSPVVAASYADGILLLTFSRGTPKLYEIYDRLALAGMGHPADLEKLRFSLLEMAHVEGFNRSPSDVTGSRLMKNGLAPVIKQAFEEIYKAPYIIKILLAELGQKAGRDVYLTVNYDGTFEEATGWAVLAASDAACTAMHRFLNQDSGLSQASLSEALSRCLLAWAVGSLAQQEQDRERSGPEQSPGADGDMGTPIPLPAQEAVVAHLSEIKRDRTLECGLLDRAVPGSSKYRALQGAELRSLLPPDLAPAGGV